MLRRKKKNILIAVLFLALAFIGVGYAALDDRLTVTSTASTAGNFDVHFSQVELLTAESSSTNLSAMTNKYGVGQPSTQAYINPILKAPTEYMTFEITIENSGNIAAVVTDIDITSTPDSTLSAYLTSKNKQWSDYYTIEQVTGYTIEENTILNPGATAQFKVKVSFNNVANMTEMPPGKLETTLTLIYTQSAVDDTPVVP